MNLFQQKINDVLQHFANNDLHLGYRRLIDCVLETNSAQWFEKFIAFHEQKENNWKEDSVIKNNCIDFLNSLQNENIKAFEINEPLVTVNGLYKKYKGGNFHLGEINLTLQYGEVWGLVGENGNGKTTLLRILSQDLHYDTGAIQYHSHINKLNLYNKRTQLTYIPQRTPQWYGSLKNNLKFAAVQYGIKNEMNELLVMMYIIRFGLYKYRNHTWAQLSSGYKMRFELARTFLRKPQLLLLDEPLANLDIFAQQIVLEDLKYMSDSISHPIGIILSSQQLYEVEKIADKILFLKNGSPMLLGADTASHSASNICVELETDASRSSVEACFAAIPNLQLTFNGGQYILQYNDNEGLQLIMQCIVDNKLPIKYLRDISNSSRRLFAQA